MRMRIKRLFKGSVTLEATLIMPIAMLVFLAFIYMIKIILFRSDLYDALYDTANMVADYSYTYDYLDSKKLTAKRAKKDKSNILNNSQNIVSLAFITSNVYLKMKDKVDDNIVLGGLIGISLADSKIRADGQDIEVCAKYCVKIPCLTGNLLVYSARQKVCVRAFVGKYQESKDDDENDKYVYIADNGKAYHVDDECSYLKVVIKEVSKEELKIVRNASGAIYYECLHCDNSPVKKDKVYICKYGLSYHNSLTCRDLNRSFRKEKLSDIGSMKGCKKCVG